jgi:hypothetical protein
MPTVQQLPAAVAVNLTDEVMLDQNGTSVAATIGQVLAAQPVGPGLLFSGATLEPDLTVLAPLASPSFTGTPTAPTPPVGDNSTRVATTAFVLANASAGGSGTITLAGDATGTGASTIDVTLASVATPGTYDKVTIDAKGRVLAGGVLAPSDISAALGYMPVQQITLAGDATGTGAGTIDLTLATVATPGTYDKVTIDAKGRVLAGGTLVPSDLAGALPGANASAADVTASAGTSARALAARASDRLNVLDFGADPTGATDSTAAFEAAMAVVPSGDWGLLWVPRGTYLLDSFINQPGTASIRVLFDDGATLTGPGGLGVDCIEAHAGPFRYRQITGGFEPSFWQPAYGSAGNPGFVADYINNTPANSRAMRIGWDHRYTNSNLYGKTHSGIDLAQQRIHSWPNLYDDSSGWALWEVVQGATLDENSIATAGLASSAEVSETDVVNNSFEAGWTWRSGFGTPVQGKAIDPWGTNGDYGGNILFAWGSVGSYDGAVGGLNFRWWCYPAVFSAGNPTAAAGTLIINGTTVDVTAGQSVASIAAAINAAGIADVGAAASTWGGVVTRLVIYSQTAQDTGTLTLSGTALASLGLAAGTFTTPRGDYAMVMGGAGTVAAGAQFVVNGVTVTVGGTGTVGMAEVAASINAASGLPGIAADVNANGQLVVTCFMPQQANGLTLANVSGQTTLAALNLNAGTYLPPTPPKAFATASGDQTSPVCLLTDQISLSFTTASGTSYGPLTVTLNGGAGTGWPADVAASLSAALSAAGHLASSFTAPGTGTAIIAVRSTNSGGQQGVQIRNTGGGTLTLADANGTPLETLGIAPGTYQPGGYSAGSQTVFMAAEDSIAAGGRGWFVGGASNATDLTVWPHAPGEVRGSFLHGLRFDYATFEDDNALVLGTGHALAWGRKQQGQQRLTVNAGTLEFNGQPLVNSAAFDAAFGAENGDLLTRAGGVWTVLTPGTLGEYLAANGPGTALSWLTPIPNAAAGTLLATSGTSGVAETITATAVFDAEFGSEVGDILVRTSAGWVALTPGAQGASLMAAGPGTPLAWTLAIPSAPAGTLLAASGTSGVAETLALGTNLSITAGTLNAAGGSGGSSEWSAGTVSVLGTGLTLTSGTLAASGAAGGTVTSVVAGSSLAGGTITTSGTVSLAPVGAGVLLGNPGTASAVPGAIAVGSGLTLSSTGTLSAPAPAQDWTAGTVTTLGGGLALTGTTLSAAGSGGTVTSVVAGAGLAGGTITTSGTVSLAAIGAGVLLGNPGTASAVPAAIAVGSGLTLSSTGTLSAPAPSVEWNAGSVDTIGSGLVLSGTTLSASGGGGSTVVRSAVAGFQLTNDATTPASVLDIGAGQCADDSGAVWITTTATFYASTGGAWTAGAGTSSAPVNKMGTGLTVAAGTWYHVFAIVNGGAPDFYFDTSVTAANAPSGTTAHRRIGSVLTTSSSQIVGFAQVLTGSGAFVYWNAVATDFQGAATSTTSARQLIPLSVPNGPTVRPLGRVITYNAQPFVLSSPAMPDVAPAGSANPPPVPGYDSAGSPSAGHLSGQIVTTTGQIGFRSAINGPTIGVFTFGYIDERGSGK